jgi:hypothetical protein
MAVYPRRRFAAPRASVNIIAVVYIVIGLVVAATHEYFERIHGIRGVGSAILAVVLWPLIFLGIDLHIR